jgi:peroxiredoxin
LTFALVLDPNGDIVKKYGVIGIPTTFLIGRDGRAVAVAVGPRAWGGPPARAILRALLDEPVPRPVGR